MEGGSADGQSPVTESTGSKKKVLPPCSPGNLLIRKEFTLSPNQQSDKFKTYDKQMLHYGIGKDKKTEHIYFVSYYDGGDGQRYVGFRGLRQFYISISDLEKRISAQTTQELHDVYTRDQDSSGDVTPKLWLKSINRKTHWECIPVNHFKLDDAAQVIHPRASDGQIEYEVTDLKWHGLVRSLDEYHARNYLRKNDSISRMRALPVHRWEGGHQVLFIKTIHIYRYTNIATLTSDQMARCFETACQAAFGTKVVAPNLTLIEGTPSSNLVKIGENILCYYDTYLDQADFSALVNYNLKRTGLQTGKYWQRYPTRIQADDVDELFDKQADKGKRPLDDLQPSITQKFTFSAATIKGQANKKRAVQQGTVMSEISATRIAALSEWDKSAKADPAEAEVPDELKDEVAEDEEEKGCLRSSEWFGSAEWLHLSAHSYGSYEGASDHAEPQQSANLVFGTKAANTMMLRAEVALQYALLKEAQLFEPQVAAQSDNTVRTVRDHQLNTHLPYAMLLVRRNRDQHDSFERLTITGKLEDSEVKDWWPPKSGDKVVRSPWFAPSLTYQVVFANTKLVKEELCAHFDLFSIHCPLLLEFCLDKAISDFLYDKRILHEAEDVYAYLSTNPHKASVGYSDLTHGTIGDNYSLTSSVFQTPPAKGSAISSSIDTSFQQQQEDSKPAGFANFVKQKSDVMENLQDNDGGEG